MGMSFVKTALALSVAAAVSFSAKIDLQGDTIVFRTSTDQTKISTHYGAFSVNSSASVAGIFSNITGGSGSQYAIRGENLLVAGSGFGGLFKGGQYGVMGVANLGGTTGTRYGGFFSAGSGTTSYGIYASGTNYSGYFSGGPVYVNGTTYPSDIKLKKNVAAYTTGLSTILKLKPSTYEYDPAVYPVLGLKAGKQYGLISQDVKQVLPEIVTYTPVLDPDNPGAAVTDSIQTINYTALIAVLIGALQEQQKEIDEIKAQLKK